MEITRTHHDPFTVLKSTSMTDFLSFNSRKQDFNLTSLEMNSLVCKIEHKTQKFEIIELGIKLTNLSAKK